MLAVTLPLALAVPVLVFQQVPQLAALISPAPAAIATWGFYRDALLVSTVLFFGLLVLRLILVTTVPRLLQVLVKPDPEDKLYGIHYWAPPPHRANNQQPLLRAAVRGQLVHRRLPARHRLQAGEGRADRLELRLGRAARQPVPQPRGHRHGGGRRPVVHQRGVLGQPLPR